MSQRQEQKQKTRENLIQVSIQLFSEQGIQNTKTLDVAKAAGMSHGSVFTHFPSKNDLLIEVIDEMGRRIAEEFRSINPSQKSLKSVLRSHLNILEKYEKFYRYLLIEGPTLPAEVRGVLLTLQNGIACHIQQALKQEVKSGHLKALPAPAFFNSWMGTVTYYLINQDIFAPKKSVIKEKKEEMIHYFLKLITL